MTDCPERWVIVMHLTTRSKAWRRLIPPVGTATNVGDILTFDSREEAEKHRNEHACQMAGLNAVRYTKHQERHEVMRLSQYLIEHGE